MKKTEEQGVNKNITGNQNKDNNEYSNKQKNKFVNEFSDNMEGTKENYDVSPRLYYINTGNQECYLPYERVEARVLTKSNDKTNPNFGKEPENRTVDELLDLGMVFLDKPSGPSSHEVSAFVRKILDVKKAGHSGTLDPRVTGVLVIALHKSTRINKLLLTAGKEYVALMRLHCDVDLETLRNTMSKFVGKIKQLPPVKSAVKRIVRQRRVYEIKIIEVKGRDVLFRVSCQAGTYIRKLIHDIGQSLGCGANMTQLRRTKVGFIREEQLVTLQDLMDGVYYYKHENNDKLLRSCIVPVEKSIEHVPKIWIKDSAVDPVCHGNSLNVPGIVKLRSDVEKNKDVAIFTLKNELVAYGEDLMNAKDILKANKGVAVKVDAVFMKPSTYPKYVKKQ